MNLTIFSRLVIAYSAILLLVAGMSGYTITQLNRLNRITHSILAIEYPTVDLGKKLIDSILSQMRYERKYLITKDKAFYDQFRILEKEFSEDLKKIIPLVYNPQKAGLIDNVKRLHSQYLLLFYKEVDIIKNGKIYSPSKYREEKEGLVDQITRCLERLITLSQVTINEKMKRSEEIGSKAVRAIVIMSALFLFLGITLSFFITRSINRPLSQLKQKTKRIAEGNFERPLDISSPPEIGELARAFNSMCQKLRELDDMKSDFMSHISHELRIPLTSIKEADGLLLDGVGGHLTDKQRRLLGIIKEESDRLIKSVDDLLDLSKMEAGMMRYNFKRSDLVPLIDQVVAEIEPLAESKKIGLSIEVEDNLPHPNIDKEWILQVLRNLLSNALKFTPEGGGIRLYARVNRSRSKDSLIEVSVTDTGPGISKENIVKIFNKFQQIRDQSTPIKGTGLGISIAKHVVDAHGGNLWVESEPNKGSTFIFTLPF